MKKNILIITFLFISIISYNQNLQLTKQQMYDDFDEFIQIIQDCNAQLPIRKKVTGVDQLKMIKEMRSRIDTISNYDSFFTTLNLSLVRLYDIHANLATGIYSSDKLENIDKIAIQMQNEYLKVISEKKKRNPYEYHFKEPFCNPVYIDGKYYMLGQYKFINKKDTIKICNPVIVAYNDIPYGIYVQMEAPFDMRWDFEKQQYYAMKSYFPGHLGTIKLEKEGEILEIDLRKYLAIDISKCDDKEFSKIYETIPRKPIFKERSKILYFANDSILYLYMNEMSSDYNNYVKSIKRIGTGKKIKKIIIDVRNNIGGSDKAWHHVLQAIIADTLPYYSQAAVKNTERIRNLFTNPKTFTDIKYLKPHTFEWLADEEFLITNFKPTYFIPDSNSLNYKGKIYILQNKNVFSSAHSFTSYAQQVEQLVSVGEPTGLMAGKGIAPILFQLKNSKFSFRLETLIDITDVKNAIDIYQDFPEVQIKLPLIEQIKDYTFRYHFDQYCEAYLYKYDYLFKKVLEFE